MKITRGVQDIKTLIPFMNKVFRKNFPKLLPKLYTSNKYANNHYVVYEGDKVIGAIASIPTKVTVYDDSLTAYGVGMVSCHKQHRGKGVMSTMLSTIIEDARREGADYMYLDGNRQRYQYYGFYPVGYEHTFTLTTPNFAHMKDDIAYTFVPLREDMLDEVVAIYESMPVRYERDDFLKTLHSWNIHKIYAIMRDCHIVGHIAYKWGTIVDFATGEPQNTAYIVKAFAAKHTRFFGRIRLYPRDTEAMHSMSAWAQTASVKESTQFKILNYKNVVRVLLNMATKTRTFVDFDLNIVIEGAESFRVTCKNNVTSIGDVLEGLPTYEMCEDDAMMYLFSPSASPYSGLPFTLPLFSPTCDNV